MVKTYYTDGACSGNPGPGGFGVVQISTVWRETLAEYIESKSVAYQYSEQCENTTNNREEMKAILHVFKIAANDPDSQYIIYSDSAYCVNMINDWIWGWAKNNWKNSKKKEVENLDLVLQLYKYISKDFFNCQVIKTKGHCGIAENELADALATQNFSKFEKVCKTNNILYDKVV